MIINKIKIIIILTGDENRAGVMRIQRIETSCP